MPSMREPQAAVTPASSPQKAGRKAEFSGSTTHTWLARPAVAHEPADGGAGAAGPGPDHDPPGHGVPLPGHLLEDRLGDVVVAAPVGGPLGEGELVQVVPAALLGQLPGDLVDLARVVDEVALPALALDEGDLLGAGRAHHDGDERQPEHPREVRLAHRRGTARRFDDGGAVVQLAVAQGIEEQRPGEAVLEAARGVRRLVLEVEVDLGESGDRYVHEMRVGAAVGVGLDAADRLVQPWPVPRRGRRDVDQGGRLLHRSFLTARRGMPRPRVHCLGSPRRGGTRLSAGEGGQAPRSRRARACQDWLLSANGSMLGV